MADMCGIRSYTAAMRPAVDRPTSPIKAIVAGVRAVLSYTVRTPLRRFWQHSEGRRNTARTPPGMVVAGKQFD